MCVLKFSTTQEFNSCTIFSSLPPITGSSFMIKTEVDFVSDVITSVQFTRVPFSSSFTGAISNLDTTGWLPSAEILEKVNVMEFTSKSEVAGTDPECKLRKYLLAIVCPSGTSKKLHSKRLPGVVHNISN